MVSLWIAGAAPTRFITIPMDRVTVLFHKSSDSFWRKTLKSMLDQAGWTEDDLKRLKLIS